MLPPFEEWRKLNRKKFPYGKRVKAQAAYHLLKEIEKMNTDTPVVTDPGITTDCMFFQTPYYSNSLACETASTSPAFEISYVPGHWTSNQEGNNPMNSYASATVAAATTETQDQRKYLSNRLDVVYHDKRHPLEAAFGLIDDEPPRTPKDLKDRLDSGKYTIRGIDKDAEDFRYWSPYDLLQWRDPDRKADQDGFSAAVKELKAERQKALDAIKIEDPKAGLEAIKALEAWTPTGAAN